MVIVQDGFRQSSGPSERFVRWVIAGLCRLANLRLCWLLNRNRWPHVPDSDNIRCCDLEREILHDNVLARQPFCQHSGECWRGTYVPVRDNLMLLKVALSNTSRLEFNFALA